VHFPWFVAVILEATGHKCTYCCACCYFCPARGAKYCDGDVRVSVCLHISKTAKLHYFLRISTGLIYVIFSHSELYDTSCIFISEESITAETASSISSTFCSVIKISKFVLCVAHQGQSLLSTVVFENAPNVRGEPTRP